jgi:hypothetical protein
MYTLLDFGIMIKASIEQKELFADLCNFKVRDFCDKGTLMKNQSINIMLVSVHR